jgi:hypothetical protein
LRTAFYVSLKQNVVVFHLISNVVCACRGKPKERRVCTEFSLDSVRAVGYDCLHPRGGPGTVAPDRHSVLTRLIQSAQLIAISRAAALNESRRASAATSSTRGSDGSVYLLYSQALLVSYEICNHRPKDRSGYFTHGLV